MEGLRRIPGAGWLALIGGGEFSFEETEVADAAWLAKTGPGGLGFIPAASGSDDYGRHFGVYLDEYFERQIDLLPIYRPRDARRAKNAQRIEECAAIYLGGGVPEALLDTLLATRCHDSLTAKLKDGGVVVAIATAAQAAGERLRGLRGKGLLDGFAWLPGGFVEPNFDPAHDRRLRAALAAGEASWGLGIPSGAAVLLVRTVQSKSAAWPSSWPMPKPTTRFLVTLTKKPCRVEHR